LASGWHRPPPRLYAWDPGNRRIIAFDKVDGRFRSQFRLSPDSTLWTDIRGMYVLPGVADQPDTLVWASANAIHDAVLEAVVVATPSPGASGASPAASGGVPTEAPAP
jgi:hypothetical protein